MIFPWLEDSARISGAATPDALWRYLAGNVHLRAMPNTFEAVCAFQRLHRDRPAHALRTAQLVCTDLRWQRVTAPLIVDIEQSGILDERALDQLADGFLWEDKLGWPVPQQWLLDAAVSLPPEARVELTELGCAWPNGTVRLRALKLLAETDREAALRGAAADASATVRAWGQKLGSQLPLPHRPAEDRSAAGPHTPARQAPEPQPSLFD